MWWMFPQKDSRNGGGGGGSRLPTSTGPSHLGVEINEIHSSTLIKTLEVLQSSEGKCRGGTAPGYGILTEVKGKCLQLWSFLPKRVMEDHWTMGILIFISDFLNIFRWSFCTHISSWYLLCCPVTSRHLICLACNPFAELQLLFSLLSQLSWLFPIRSSTGNSHSLPTDAAWPVEQFKHLLFWFSDKRIKDCGQERTLFQLTPPASKEIFAVTENGWEFSESTYCLE